MKTFQTEIEIAANGVLLLEKLPFATGERVAVTISSTAAFSEMRSYAEKMGSASGDFIEETRDHVAERLLRDTTW